MSLQNFYGRALLGILKNPATCFFSTSSLPETFLEVLEEDFDS